MNFLKAPAVIGECVHWGTTPPFVIRSRKKGAKAEGLRYEKVVKGYLGAEYPTLFKDGFWMRFRSVDELTYRYCQPDCLLIDENIGHIYVVEIKLRHCLRAWAQLELLYAPLIKHLYGNGYSYSLLEICRWYDPSVEIPGKIKLVKDPLFFSEEGAMGVHIWKPK